MLPEAATQWSPSSRPPTRQPGLVHVAAW
jgi:hypothetical protein